jgi:hypothetical protein
MGRIRDLAKDLNVQISAGNVNLDLLLSRFDVGQVRALSLTLHGELDNGSLLVRNLQGLIADCMKIDSVLVPLSHYAILPRDRSYSRTGKDPLSEIRNTINNVASAASQIFEELKRVLQ